jgi:hypothetical protein
MAAYLHEAAQYSRALRVSIKRAAESLQVDQHDSIFTRGGLYVGHSHRIAMLGAVKCKNAKRRPAALTVV